MTLRPATQADLPAIEALVLASYTPWIDKIGQRPGPMGDDYAALIAAGQVTVLDEGGAVLGLLVLIPEPQAMLLDNLAVSPAAQGRGFGRLLVAEAEARTRAAGLPVLRLYTHAKMETNVALYGRLGFAVTERRMDKGFDRVFMAKPV